MSMQAHPRRLSLERRLAAAIVLAGGAAALEIVGSWLSGSLALLSDAGHVGTDALALGLSLAALRASVRPHTPKHSFGFHRLEVLAALLNGLLLIGLAAYLIVTAYGRLPSPPLVEGGTMFVVGLSGLAANATMIVLLRDWAKTNINARGAFLHAYGDTLGSAGVVVGAAVIHLTGTAVLDVFITLFIVGLIVFSAVRLVRDGVHILLEASPAGIRPRDVADAILTVPGVKGVHDLHIWTVTSGLYALTGHLSVTGETTVDRASAIVALVEDRLLERFGIAHTTLQVDSLQEEMISPADIAREPGV